MHPPTRACCPQPGTNVPLPEMVDPMKLLPSPDDKGHRSFVHYPGSLTTPPCSEKVDWFVMTEKVDVDPAQVRSPPLVRGLQGMAEQHVKLGGMVPAC